MAPDSILAGEWWTSTVPKNGDETHESGGAVEHGGTRFLPVARSVARVINLGNYESARLEILLVLFGQDHDLLDEAARKFTMDALAREVAKVQKRESVGTLEFCPDGVEACTVGLRYGMTVNLGDFESVKIDVGQTVRCEPGLLVEALDGLRGWCRDRLGRDIKHYKQNR